MIKKNSGKVHFDHERPLQSNLKSINKFRNQSMFSRWRDELSQNLMFIIFSPKY